MYEVLREGFVVNENVIKEDDDEFSQMRGTDAIHHLLESGGSVT